MQYLSRAYTILYMIKNEQSFNKAQKCVNELQELQKRLPFRLSYDDQEELDALMQACQAYQGTLDRDTLIRSEQLAEQAVYDDMMAFEERFMNSMMR